MKIFLIIILSFFYINISKAEIDTKCFLSKSEITSNTWNINIKSKENDLFIFTSYWKLLNIKSYWSYKKTFFSYYILDDKLPTRNIKDNNKKSFFEFDNIYHNEYRFTIRFDYTLLANTFDYEFLTNHEKYKIEISKDAYKWKEIKKEDLLKENLNFVRFTFLREKDPKIKKYLDPKEPIKIYHLKFFNKWHYDYIFENDISQKITIYKDYICDRKRLINEYKKNIYKSKKSEITNTYDINFIKNKEEIK